MEKIKIFLTSFIEVPFDNEIAEKAAIVRRFYKLPLPDAGIAATALVNNVPLVTYDKSFHKVKEIIVVVL